MSARADTKRPSERSKSCWRRPEVLLLLLAIDSPDWRPLEFAKIPRHTTYTVVRDGDRRLVEARSEAAASGLARRVRIDTREWPIVAWRWKVENLIEKADGRAKSGDDYPARIYVAFEFDPARVRLFERAK